MPVPLNRVQVHFIGSPIAPAIWRFYGGTKLLSGKHEENNQIAHATWYGKQIGNNRCFPSQFFIRDVNDIL